MRKVSWPAVVAAFFLASCTGNAGSVPPAPVVPPAVPIGTYIKHVVVIIQENRSFEQLFAGWPGADAPMYGTTSTGKRVRLTPLPFEQDQDLGHLWSHAMLEWNNGKMDRFNLDRFGTLGDGPRVGLYAYTYVERSEIEPYRTMARDYVLADKFFPTEFGTSFTAHQDAIAGEARIDASHSLVDTPTAFPWGCDAPKGTTTPLVDVNRKITPNGPFPCLDQYATIADTLDKAHVSWKYYTQPLLTPGGQVWTAFDAIKRVRYGPDWKRNVIMPDTKVLTDPGAGELPSVSFVIPEVTYADHPAVGSRLGPDWVGDIVDVIGRSKYWKDTAIVVVWDDWGGFYDNVPPPQLDYVGLGIRTPMLIVSPYAKQNYVSHVQYEYGSILKFIEQVYGLPSLHSTDDRANSPLDAFDFTQKPRAFVPIHTNHPPSYFINLPPPAFRPED
jgi:phospholipase C